MSRTLDRQLSERSSCSSIGIAGSRSSSTRKLWIVNAGASALRRWIVRSGVWLLLNVCSVVNGHRSRSLRLCRRLWCGALSGSSLYICAISVRLGAFRVSRQLVEAYQRL